MAFTYLSRCDWSGSHSATSSTLGSDVQALTWLIPRPPQPTTAIRTVLLALASMEEVVVATAAVVIKKFRRFMGPPGLILRYSISPEDNPRICWTAQNLVV